MACASGDQLWTLMVFVEDEPAMAITAMDIGSGPVLADDIMHWLAVASAHRA